MSVTNSFDQGETPSYLAFSSGSKLFAYGTIVAGGGLRVKGQRNSLPSKIQVTGIRTMDY